MATVGRKKGTPKTGGRVKGTANRVTREFRETVSALLAHNADNVQIWLAKVADGDDDVKPDPGRALDLLGKLAEYASPKLARTELTGKDGAELFGRIERTVKDPAK